MSIKLHKVIHCFNSLIILLYEYRLPSIFFCVTPTDGLIWMSSMSGCTNQTLHKNKFKNKILFNLIFIIISFMTHKNSILELILTYTYEEHRYRTNVYRCKKKNKKKVWCDDTYPSCHRHPRPMECFDLS
jgi:hypothetical protein